MYCYAMNVGILNWFVYGFDWRCYDTSAIILFSYCQLIIPLLLLSKL